MSTVPAVQRSTAADPLVTGCPFPARDAQMPAWTPYLRSKGQTMHHSSLIGWWSSSKCHVNSMS